MVFIDGYTVSQTVIDECSLIMTEDEKLIPERDKVQAILLAYEESDAKEFAELKLPKNVDIITIEEKPARKKLTQYARTLKRFLNATYEPVKTTIPMDTPEVTVIEKPGLFTLVKETYHSSWRSPDNADIMQTLRGFTIVHNTSEAETLRIEFTVSPFSKRAVLISLGALGLFIIYILGLWFWERKTFYRKTGSDITLPPVGTQQTQSPPSE
jgi:hypothetical protein